LTNPDASVDAQPIDPEKMNAAVTSQPMVSNEEKAMLESHAYIVDAVASSLFSKKKLPSTIDYNDLHSVGFEGLLKAFRRFDQSKDTQFKTYANIRVRGEMLDLIRREWRAKSSGQHDQFLEQIKERVSQAIDSNLEHGEKPVVPKNLLSIAATSYMVSLETVLDAHGDNIPDNQQTLDAEYEMNDEFQLLNKVVLSLPKEDVTFIDLFYRRGLTQKEISVKLNRSEATISRNHNRILLRLKELLNT
jgi:RNA polymerase sigma factor for flagellar operon FliA